MKLTLSRLHKTVALAAVSWALVGPAPVTAADRLVTPRVAPLGVAVQQVNYNNINYANGTCPNGNCQAGGNYTWSGNSWNGNGGWGGGCWNGRCQHGLAHGNAFVRPPAVWPVARTPNTYGYYWSPQLMGGQGGAAQAGNFPMIYHPTDTTQLGFSYQHVPRWGYRPEMLPPAPVPNWPLGQHTAYGSGFGFGGGGSCPTGNCWNGGTTVVNPTPVPDTNMSSPVTPAPIPANPVNPAPGGIKVPPPPPEAPVNQPEPEAAVFPPRARN